MSEQRPLIEKPICSTAVLWKGTSLVRAIQFEQTDQTPDPFEAPNADIWKHNIVKPEHLWGFNSRLSTHGSTTQTPLSP